MDPQYEQRLRDEVIYLHSLWHQGPPRPAAPHSLPPSNTAHFKKEGRPRGRKGRNSKSRPISTAPDSKSSPGKEWDCPTPAPEAASTWETSSGAQPASSSHVPTPEDESKFVAKKSQRKALETVSVFLNRESDSIDSGGDEDHEFIDEDDERREYTFFLKVFMEDAVLKEYYVKNFFKGEFSCLVCGAMGGKNTGKKFKGCLPLVQHSIAIAKTKKKRAHRAYGQAVCKVLSWDIDRLPAIVSLLSDFSGGAQGTMKFDKTENSISISSNLESGDGNNGEVVPENATLGGETLLNTDEGIMHSSAASVANTKLEGIGMVHPANGDETVADGLTSVNNTLLVADANNNNLKGPIMVYPSDVVKTVEDGWASSSLMGAGVDDNLEDLSLVNSSNMTESSIPELASGCLNGQDEAGMCTSMLHGLQGEDKTED